MLGFGPVLTDDQIHEVLAFLKSKWPQRERRYQREMTRRDFLWLSGIAGAIVQHQHRASGFGQRQRRRETAAAATGSLSCRFHLKQSKRPATLPR